MKIGLWAFFGLGNLGDDAIQRAVIHNISQRRPNAKLFAVCLDPEQVSKQFSISAYPIYRGPIFLKDTGEQLASATAATAETHTADTDRDKMGGITKLLQRVKSWHFFGSIITGLWQVREEARYLRKMYRFVKSLDLLIISGSGVLDDTWKGKWRRPFALYRWCLVASLANTTLAFVSVGATSLSTRRGKYFGGKALGYAEYRSYRDKESKDVAIQLRVPNNRNDLIMPDLAFSLSIPSRANRISKSAGAIVGLGPIPFCDPRVWPKKDSAAYHAYVDKVSKFAVWLANSGYQIRFILGHRYVDALTVQDVIDRVHSEESTKNIFLEQPQNETVTELLNSIADLDYVVSSRFHGVLLSYLAKKPVIALSYNSKICNLMASVDQRDNCLEISSFTLEECIAAFQRICADQTTIEDRLAETNAKNFKVLTEQYDRVLDLATKRRMQGSSA